MMAFNNIALLEDFVSINKLINIKGEDKAGLEPYDPELFIALHHSPLNHYRVAVVKWHGIANDVEKSTIAVNQMTRGRIKPTMTDCI